MRLTLSTKILVIVAFLMAGCGKTNTTEVKVVSEKDIKACDAAIIEQKKLTVTVKGSMDDALAGDSGQSYWWYKLAYAELRKPESYSKMTMAQVAEILRKPVDGDSDEYIALYKRYEGCVQEMHAAGYGSGLPLITAARLGVPPAQYDLYQLLSNVVERRATLRAGFVFKEQSRSHPYAYRHYSDYGPLPPLSVAEDKLPVVEVLEPAMASPSYGYMLDLEWKAPAGPWDPMYKDGKFRYKEMVFSPHELLTKATAADGKYRARLAAVELISSNSASGREAAAKVLLGLAESGDCPLYDVLVNTCIATIHLRGVGSPVDLSKAAEVMISSRSAGMVARGILLACRDGVLLNSDASDDSYLPVDGNAGRDLVDGVSHQFGWGRHGRDLEKAYFHYFRFIFSHEQGDSSDLRFARQRMSEIEKQLSPDSLLVLQKNCYLWRTRWPSQGPYFIEWRDRFLTDQQQAR
jgi:hypothetical protein